MFNTRYPHLFRPSEAPGLPPEKRRALVAYAEEVRERVGCVVLYNARGGRLYVHLAHDIAQGLDLPPPLIQLRLSVGSWDWSVLTRADELCRVVRSARIDWAQRDRMDRWNAASVKAEDEQRHGAMVAEHTRDILDMYNHCKARFGMDHRFSRYPIPKRDRRTPLAAAGRAS